MGQRSPWNNSNEAELRGNFVTNCLLIEQYFLNILICLTYKNCRNLILDVPTTMGKLSIKTCFLAHYFNTVASFIWYLATLCLLKRTSCKPLEKNMHWWEQRVSKWKHRGRTSVNHCRHHITSKGGKSSSLISCLTEIVIKEWIVMSSVRACPLVKCPRSSFQIFTNLLISDHPQGRVTESVTTSVTKYGWKKTFLRCTTGLIHTTKQ